MADTGENSKELIDVESMNKTLRENQSLLHHENQKLHEDIKKLSKQLEDFGKSSVEPEMLETLRKEKDHLITLNDTLKKKIKRLKIPATSSNLQDINSDQWENDELIKTAKILSQLLEKIKNSEKLDIKAPEQSLTTTVESLMKKLDEQQRKLEDASDTIRKLRDDDEKYILKERINDMKQLITDLELENAKLKFECEQLSEDVNSFKKQLNEAVEEVKLASKKCYQVEDERDQLKGTIRELEDEKIRLKKEVIDEMNEANRAKSVSVELEVALHHVSDAYEHKRQEVTALHKQLDDAEKIIRNFKIQLEPTLNTL